MTVGTLKEIMASFPDDTQVVTYTTLGGTDPIRSTTLRTQCFVCGGDGRTWFPGHDFPCPNCKGTGQKAHLILSDVER